MQPPSNIVDIYKSQGWTDEAAINADIAAGHWQGKVGSSGGEAGADLSQLPSAESYVQSQFASEDPYIQAILNRYASFESPLDIYSRLEKEAGVPQLRTTAGTLMKEVGSIEDILSSIEPDVAARTRESLVTEAQRRGLVQAKQEPWAEKLTKVSTALGRVMEGLGLARQDISTKTALALQGYELQLKPLEFMYAVKVDRNARLLAGFTEDRETQLTLLLDKLQRQRQLDDREWELANTLSAEEREYIRMLQKAAVNAGATITGNEDYKELLRIIGTQAAGSIGLTEGDYSDFDDEMGWG